LIYLLNKINVLDYKASVEKERERMRKAGGRVTQHASDAARNQLISIDSICIYFVFRIQSSFFCQ
jgi:hypothetical protein